MSKNSGCLIAIFTSLLLVVFYVFIRPIDDKIYFKYPTQYYSYDGGQVEFYLVNSNPKNGHESHFFRVSIDVSLEHIKTCTLIDFDWELKRSSDGVILFSTKYKTGILGESGYFENKIGNSIFKGISGSGMGDNEFEAILKVNPKNMCGFEANEQTISKIMRLKHERLTLWDAWKSV